MCFCSCHRPCLFHFSLFRYATAASLTRLLASLALCCGYQDFVTQLRIFLLQEGPRVTVRATGRIVFSKSNLLKGTITRSAKVGVDANRASNLFGCFCASTSSLPHPPPPTTFPYRINNPGWHDCYIRDVPSPSEGGFCTPQARGEGCRSQWCVVVCVEQGKEGLWCGTAHEQAKVPFAPNAGILHAHGGWMTR